MQLPAGHWMPDSTVGTQTIIEKFNVALGTDDLLDYCHFAYEAFCALARRYDLYLKLGNNGQGKEEKRFLKLFADSFSLEEAHVILSLPATVVLYEVEPVVDSSLAQRQRNMAPGVVRESGSNPYKIFNDFKVAYHRFEQHRDNDPDFRFAKAAYGLLLEVVYIQRRNMQRVALAFDAAKRDKVHALPGTHATRDLLEQLINFYFFSTNDIKLVIPDELKGNPALGAPVAYAEAEIGEAPTTSVCVATVPQPFDFRAIEHLVPPRSCRQLVPVTINSERTIAYHYAEPPAHTEL